MQHVDEGQLHAYLDGELTGPGDDPRALALHVESCAECGARMEGVRALRERARALLADPRPVEQPPFEAVVARSRRAPAPSVWLRRRIAPLAWAASVVVALGIGWLARDLLRAPEGPRLAGGAAVSDPVAESAAPLPAPGPAATGAERVEELAQRSTAAADEGARAAPAASAVELPASTEAAQSDATSVAAADAAPLALATAPPPPPTEMQESAPATAPAAPRMTPVARGEGIASSAGAAAAWTPVERGAAEERLGGPVPTVPGLRVLSTEALAAAAAPTVRVRQALPGGGVLTLISRRAEASAPRAFSGRAASAAAPQLQVEAVNVSVQRGGLLLTVSGPLPADSLRSLLDTVR